MKRLQFIAATAMLLLFAVSCEKAKEPDPIVDSDDFAYLQGKSAKRGCAYGWLTGTDVNLMGPGITWSYNWANTSSNDDVNQAMAANGITYFPMAWNGNYDKNKIKNWIKAHPETDHILAFNEPNLKDQANMTPAKAAQLWPELKALADECGVKLTSPAMNWGTVAGYQDPIVWLDEFLKQPGVSIDDFDVIAIHIYMDNVAAVMSDINRYAKYNKKIWLTEFCSWNAKSAASQVTFMSQTLNALEQSDMVGRYAWFSVRWGNKGAEEAPFMCQLTKTTPSTYTSRGVAYLYLSTFDKSVVYPMGKRIPACQYRACSVDKDYYSVPVAMSTDTESGAILQLDGFTNDQYVDYKVSFNGSSKTVFQLRYSTSRLNKIGLYIVDDSGNESLVTSFELSSTGGATNWATFETPVSISAGEKVIRLRSTEGLLRSTWLKFTTK